ncbi:hypothetical protein Tco_1362949 [Tanacetum coccineum]
MRDKETSFFFTNFPESWDTRALWKVFSMYVKVVDVYVAFKRTKKNTSLAKTCYKVYEEEPDSGALFYGCHENCWVCKAKNFHVLQNAWDIIDNNGLSECKWFDDLKLWEVNGASYGRLSWLIIEGLPPFAINLGFVRSTLSIFGKILEVGSLIIGNTRFESLRAVSNFIVDLLYLQNVALRKIVREYDESREDDELREDEESTHAQSPCTSYRVSWSINTENCKDINTRTNDVLMILALGWHLEETHVTWAHLEKKQTRLRTYTKSLEESCSQSVETASQA